MFHMAKTRLTGGCPAGCWLVRGTDGKLWCDCDAAFHRPPSMLRGLAGIEAQKPLVLLGALGAAALIIRHLRNR